MDRIQLHLTGNCISIDLRGAKLPTRKPRPHIPILKRAQGYTAKDLQAVTEKCEEFQFSRNIGVLSRVVTFTLGDWEDDGQCSRVSGELEQFTEFIRSEFPSDLAVSDPPYTYLDSYD